MKKIFPYIIVSTLTFFDFTVSAQEINDLRINIAGTGISIVPPTGIEVAPAGSSLIDDKGETLFHFVMGDKQFNPEKSKAYKALFTHPPESVTISTHPSSLYRRTRAIDGGKWDGWYLSVPSGNKVLTVIVTYTGNSSDYFSGFRKSLLSIAWDQTIADPERALGIRLSHRDLQVVKGGFGGVLYNETGEIGKLGKSLLISALPMKVEKARALIPKNCDQLIHSSFREKPFIGPKIKRVNNFFVCEAWNESLSDKMQYVAFILLSNGALINAIGTDNPKSFNESLSVFRSAIHKLEIINKTKSKRGRCEPPPV